MKKVSRFITVLASVILFATPFPSYAAYPQCLHDSDCHANEVCAYEISNTAQGQPGTCMQGANVPPGWTSSYIPPGGIINSGTPSAPSGPSGINFTYLNQYGSAIINIINFLVAPVLMAVAFIVFLFGVYRYFILGATNETERGKGKDFVLWGVIAFVVIFSLWGLVGIVGSTLGLAPGGSAPPYPTL